MKRLLYIGAIVCLLGLAVCAIRFANLPDVGQAVDSVRNSDPSAMDDIETATAPNQAGDQLWHYAGLWLLGGVTCVIFARRVK